jgi:hypothetical protein
MMVRKFRSALIAGIIIRLLFENGSALAPPDSLSDMLSFILKLIRHYYPLRN